MGEVFVAEDTRLERKVALKILPEKLSIDTEVLRCFKQEAKAASALNHPNIITVYEIGEQDGTNFIASEFIEGKTLCNLVKPERRKTKPNTISFSSFGKTLTKTCPRWSLRKVNLEY